MKIGKVVHCKLQFNILKSLEDEGWAEGRIANLLKVTHICFYLHLHKYQHYEKVGMQENKKRKTFLKNDIFQYCQCATVVVTRYSKLIVWISLKLHHTFICSLQSIQSLKFSKTIRQFGSSFSGLKPIFFSLPDNFAYLKFKSRFLLIKSNIKHKSWYRYHCQTYHVQLLIFP